METKNMEKKNFKFKFYVKNNKQIDLPIPNELNDVTEEYAKAYGMGLIMGLFVKYKTPKVEILTSDGKIIQSYQ